MNYFAINNLNKKSLLSFGLIKNVLKYVNTTDKAYFVLLIFTFLVHGLLLINDGIYYDTWIIYNFQTEQKWDLLYKLLSDSGRPIMGIVYWTIGLFPNQIFATRIYELLCIYFSAVLIYKIGKEYFNIYPLQMIIVAMVSICYPIYFQFSVNMDVYILYYFVFISGVYISFKTTRCNRIRHWLLRSVSIILIFLSFDLSSLLVFYLGFFSLFFIYSQRNIDLNSYKLYKKIIHIDNLINIRNHTKLLFAFGMLIIVSGFMVDWFGFSTPGWIGTNQQLIIIVGALIIILTGIYWLDRRLSENRANEIMHDDLGNYDEVIKDESSKKPITLFSTLLKMFHFAITHPDYLILPFAFWFIKKWFWPTSNYYANYNTIFVPWNIEYLRYIYLNIYKEFINNAIFQQFILIIENWLLHPLFYIGVILFGLYLYKKLKIYSYILYDEKNHPSWFLLAIGLFLLILGIFPYAAVGLNPEPIGWDSRHTILIGMPMGIIIAGILQLQIHNNRTVKNHTIILSRLGWVFAVVLLFSFSQLVINNYLALQARWIIDRSVITNLSKIPEYEEYSVFWVDNKFSPYKEEYRFYEWAGIFKKAWGNESHIGFAKRHKSLDSLNGYSKYYTEANLLGTFNPHGYQATLTIRPGRDGTIENYLSNKRIMSVEYIRYLDGFYDNLYLTARYFYYKIFRQYEMDVFLSNVTNLSVE